jgi:carbamoyltransferase
MTIILGLHFGHDAHAVLLEDGEVLSYIQRDKISRIKNHGGVNACLIKKCLDLAGRSESDIDYIAITNTQYREFVFESPDYLCFSYSPNGVCRAVDYSFDSLAQRTSYSSTEIREAFGRSTLDRINRANRSQYPQLIEHYNSDLQDWSLPYKPYIFTARSGINQISEQFFADSDLGSFTSNSHAWASENMYMPLLVKLAGIEIPGFFVDHHFAHANSVSTKSQYANSLIFSSDGSGASVLGNLVCVKIANKIYPFMHTSYRGGQFYEMAAMELGLDCGKFMGLAGYGIADPYLIATFNDTDLQLLDHAHVRRTVEDYYGCQIDPSRILDRINTGFAITCQHLFERSTVRYILAILAQVRRLVPDIECLELSGGSALNCPTNTVLAEVLGSKNVFIEPCCNDEGLGLGAAHAVGAMIYEEKWKPLSDKSRGWATPFLGPHASKPSSKILEKLTHNGAVFPIADCPDWSVMVSQYLINGSIGMVMRGRAEIGPRALGNRSIIALPLNANVARSVNRIKQREEWRPLAPACLSTSFSSLFRGPENPYMLMTDKVNSLDYPGITHVDGTARVQAVTENHETFYKILMALERAMGSRAVLLNTSLNRKGEPILNDADIALEFFIESGCAFILLDDFLVVKNEEGQLTACVDA